MSEGIEIRRARSNDLPATDEVFRESIGELFERHAFESPRPSRREFLRLQAHVLEHDSERFWVAEEAGRLIGFGAALERGRAWFLSALFVRPSRQAEGIGKELFRRTWAGASDRVALRLTVVDAIQPISLGLYSRAGLLPVTALMNLGGKPAHEPSSALVPLAASSTVLAEIDRAAYGFDRRADHRFWSAEAELTVWGRAGDAVAYTYRSEGGRVGPVAGLSQRDAATALAEELAGSSGREISLLVPASSRELLAVAVTAGLRYTDPPGLILANEPAAPTALALSGYSLY